MGLQGEASDDTGAHLGDRTPWVEGSFMRHCPED